MHTSPLNFEVTVNDNYKIIYKSLFLNKIRNKYGEYPQNNFEKIDRIKFPKTIILKKT